MIKIHEDVKFILNKLIENEYKAYLIGGCVRDMLLNIPPHDYDITTSATPDQVISLFEKTFLTGKKHGTVTVIHNHTHCEVTTFRIDGEYIKNRKPKQVIFTDDLKEDIKRRDFTINSIAFNEVDGFVDYFKGEEDIKNKIIRTVGAADERFSEDALRILRGIRFAATFGFQIEENTYFSMKKLSYLIKNISMERILSELIKMFESNPFESVKFLLNCDIFHIIDSNLNCSELKCAILKNLKQKTFEMVLTILIYDNCYFMEILNHLKCKNEIKNQIKTMIDGIHYPLIPNKSNIKMMLFELNCQVEMERILELRELLGENMCEVEKLYTKIIEQNECFRIKDLKVNGTHLKSIGIEDKKIGATLKKLLFKVIEDPLLNKEDILMTQLREDVFFHGRSH